MLVEFANLSPDNEMLRNNTNSSDILQINSKFFFTWWNFTPGFDTEGFLNVWKRHQFHQMLWIYLDEQKYFDPVHSILNSNLPFTDYLTHSIYSLSLASIPRIKSCKINKENIQPKESFTRVKDSLPMDSQVWKWEWAGIIGCSRRREIFLVLKYFRF